MCLICVTRRFFCDRHSNSKGKQLLSRTLTSIMATASGLSSIIGWTCVLIITDVHVVSQSLCDGSSYLEVKEGRNNTFVCTGLTPQQKVYWSWASRSVSTCDTTSCNNIFGSSFQSSKIEGTSSNIILYVSFPDLDYIANTSLSCQQESGSTKVTCQLDVVYPAEDANCHIQFSRETWEVTGWCTASKARSRRNRYGCLVYQTSQQSPTTLVGNFTMSTTLITGTNYSSGNCQIKIALPPEGKYNYSAIIIPGEVLVFPSFNGSNEIRRPSESPQHNCPQYVTEGEDVNCLCHSDDVGLPSGSLIWIKTGSSELKIEKVNRTYTGLSYVCNLMWNNTAVQRVLYVLTVNYASRVLSFKIDNKADDIVTVKENTNVSVVCQAEGRPLPTLRLFNMSSDNQDVELTTANNELELQYTLSSVKCETTGTYSCKSENGVSGDEKRILLIVFCAPTQTTQDIYSATFNQGEAKLEFEIIAYPPPDVLYIFYMGSSLNNTTLRTVESKNSVKIEYIIDNMYRYMVTCAVTLLNETIFSTGVYQAVFSNSLGNISLTFEIREQVHTPGESKSEVAGPVAGGVVGAVVLIALAVSAVIFIIRRKRRRIERGTRTNSVMTSKTDRQRGLEIYDQLQTGDVNSPSVYQTLGSRQTSSDFTDSQDQGKSHVYEVPIDLHEYRGGTH